VAHLEHRMREWRRRPFGGNSSIGFIGRGRALPGFGGAKSFVVPPSISAASSCDTCRRREGRTVYRRKSPSQQARQGSFVPVHVRGDLNWGGQRTMTLRVAWRDALVIPMGGCGCALQVTISALPLVDPIGRMPNGP